METNERKGKKILHTHVHKTNNGNEKHKIMTKHSECITKQTLNKIDCFVRNKREWKSRTQAKPNAFAYTLDTHMDFLVFRLFYYCVLSNISMDSGLEKNTWTIV